MNLYCLFLDIFFSVYVYDGGYFGFVFIFEMNKIIVYVEGIFDYIWNFIILNGGEFYCYLIGLIGERI